MYACVSSFIILLPSVVSKAPQNRNRLTNPKHAELGKRGTRQTRPSLVPTNLQRPGGRTKSTSCGRPTRPAHAACFGREPGASRNGFAARPGCSKETPGRSCDRGQLDGWSCDLKPRIIRKDSRIEGSCPGICCRPWRYLQICKDVLLSIFSGCQLQGLEKSTPSPNHMVILCHLLSHRFLISQSSPRDPSTFSEGDVFDTLV